MDCFVKVNAEGKVTDMGSFYHLPSSILKSTKYSTLYAAFSFYNVCTTLTRPQLFRDLLIMAKVPSSPFLSPFLSPYLPLSAP